MSILAEHLGPEYYAVEWAIRIGALGVVPLRRSASAAHGWLLLIFFLPLPGLILYLMIGRPKFPKWRLERAKSLRPFFAEVAAKLAGARRGLVARARSRLSSRGRRQPG